VLRPAYPSGGSVGHRGSDVLRRERERANADAEGVIDRVADGAALFAVTVTIGASVASLIITPIGSARPSSTYKAEMSGAVRPVRSASWRTSTRPACDTTPVPPPVTSRPRDHAVAFTWKVLLALD
jgi:hypothetical protein